MLVGIVPFKSLPSKSSRLNESEPKRDAGIVPVKLLPSRFNSRRLLKAPREAGIVPPRAVFCLRSSVSSFCSLPISSGIAPDKLLFADNV